jgi:hypothetical protein
MINFNREKKRIPTYEELLNKLFQGDQKFLTLEEYKSYAFMFRTGYH